MAVKILQDDLWPTIKELVRQFKHKHKHVAVAYLGRGACKLLPLRKGDSLVVDMSEGAVKSGQTGPKEVEKYLKRGVSVYTCSNLHAKVYVFDKNFIVGSANVSRHSQQGLIEAGLLCSDRDALTQARGLVKSLMVESVTPGYVKRCKRLYKPPKIHYNVERKQKKAIPPGHPPLWVVGVVTVNLSEQEERLRDTEQRKAEKKLKDARKYIVETIRWDGNPRFKEGDLLVQTLKDGNVKEVYPPSRILRITPYKSFDNRKWPRTLVLIEEPKCPKPLRWQDFKNAVVRAGIRRISPNSQRQIRSPEVAHKILGLWS